MATITNILFNKVNKNTGENIPAMITSAWRDGTLITPQNESQICGALYNKQVVGGVTTYFKWMVDGPFSLRRLTIPNQANLAKLVADYFDEPQTILVNRTVSFTDNFTIPANFTIKFERGARFAIAAGKTLTIEGSVEAGLHQIFSGDGLVAFKSNQYHPAWWGAKGDGITDDYAAVKKAYESCVENATLVLPQKLEMKSTVTVSKTVTIDANWSDMSKWTNSFFSFRGDWELKADISQIALDISGKTLVYCANYGSFSKGDVVKVISLDRYEKRRTNSPRLGEFAVVDVVGEGYLLLNKRLQYNYVTSPRIARLKDIAPKFINANLKSTSENLFFNLRNLKNSVFSNIHIKEAHGPIFQLRSCYQTRITNLTCNYAEDNVANVPPRYGYVITDISSYGSMINGLQVGNARHGFTTNGGYPADDVYEEFTDNGETMHCTISNGVGIGCNNSTWDTHDNGFDIIFDNCHSFGCATYGFHPRAEFVTLNNCVSRDFRGIALHSQDTAHSQRRLTVNNFDGLNEQQCVLGQEEDPNFGYSDSNLFVGGRFESRQSKPIDMLCKQAVFKSATITSNVNSVYKASRSNLAFEGCTFIHNYSGTSYLGEHNGNAESRVSGGTYKKNGNGTTYLAIHTGLEGFTSNKFELDGTQIDASGLADPVVNGETNGTFRYSYAHKTATANSSNIYIERVNGDATPVEFRVDRILDDVITCGIHADVAPFAPIPLTPRLGQIVVLYHNGFTSHAPKLLPEGNEYSHPMIRPKEKVGLMRTGTFYREIFRGFSTSVAPVTTLSLASNVMNVPEFNRTYVIPALGANAILNFPPFPRAGDFLKFIYTQTRTVTIGGGVSVKGVDPAMSTTTIPFQAGITIVYDGIDYRIENIEPVNRVGYRVNSTTSDLALSTLNSSYPYGVDFGLGYEVDCPNINKLYKRSGPTTWKIFTSTNAT